MATTTALPPAVPKVHGLPVLGNLLDLRHDSVGFFAHVARECGDIGAYAFGPYTSYLLNDPELIHRVLVTDAAKYEKTALLRETSRPVLGNGLVTSLNDFHKPQRKLVAPVFQHNKVASYADLMATYAGEAAASWAEGETVDIAAEMMKVTLRVIGKVLFDVDVRDEAADPTLADALEAANRYISDRSRSLVRLPEWLPTPTHRREQAAIDRLNAIVYGVIAERRASGEDHGDFLTMLLRSHDEDGTFMTDLQVRDEAMTLFLAGHETTANGLAWAWWLLTQHPEAYDRMRDEGDRVLAGRLPTAADARDLPYTLQVFKETLRHHSPVPTVARQASVDVEVGGREFPAGTVFVISPFVLHHHPDLFPDPDRFDPDRFSPEREREIPKHAYIPFVSGPRNCIGASFALLEGQLILAAIAQRVTFALAPGAKVEPEALVTLRPKHGVPVIVHRRDAE